MGIQEAHPAPTVPVNPYGIRGGDPNARTIAGLKLLRTRGVLNEASEQLAVEGSVPPEVLALIPGSVARENVIMPLHFDGETITVAAVNPSDIATADKLRFILAKDVKLVPARREVILEMIDRHYPAAETESVDSMLQEFTDTAIDFGKNETSLDLAGSPMREMRQVSLYDRLRNARRSLGKGVVEFKKGVKGLKDEDAGFECSLLEDLADEEPLLPGQDPTRRIGGTGMFHYTVEEGQRVLMWRRDGTMHIIVGPRRVWRGWSTFQPMKHFVAHPDKFLMVRFRDGRQEHLPGPADIWLDPRIHQQITVEDALPLAAKEAVVVYTKAPDSAAVSRRLVFGPALFVPQPGEWLHTFSWHASKGGSKGVQKVPNGLVFQKLWLMPDQMYHDVTDVRTADDALLTIRLMIFFELIDIERMLDATHDPIGDFVNAASSDVVAFTGRHDFERFKGVTHQLNDLESYPQLTGRAAQCGYRINKVVYRGYGAAASLQAMHDQAIEARTRLQLDRATEQQAQELENYKLDCQLARAGKRRLEQVGEVEHDLELARRRQEAELRQREAQMAFVREKARQDAELRLTIRRGQDAQQREHLAALREMSVDLTAYLTQHRADRVIELRGTAAPHVHLDQLTVNGKEAGKD